MSAVQQAIAYLQRDIDRMKAIIADCNAELEAISDRMLKIEQMKMTAETALKEFEDLKKVLVPND